MLKGNYFLPLKTVHTSRTIMLDEFTILMNYHSGDSDFTLALDENIMGKKTQDNIKKTNKAILRLYSLDNKFPPFQCFNYFYQSVDSSEKPLLTFIYAYYMDFLLHESIDIVSSVPEGERVPTENFMNNIESKHFGRYSPKTCLSAAQNIASSWKKAGFIQGKIKNIRTKVKPTANTLAFAFLMAYLNDDRGEYILQDKFVQILEVNNTTLKDLTAEANIKGLMEFRAAGSVVSISFNNLFKILGIYGIES